MNKRAVVILCWATLTLGLDQATKIWARGALRGQPAITVIDGYLEFAYFENRGMAFSLGRNLPGGRFILIGVGIVVLVLVWRIMRHIQHRRMLADTAYGLVAGGAIGNMIDRVYIGRVVDFILMHWRHKYSWPAYNVADIALVIGVGLLLIAMGGQPETQSKGRRKRK